MTLYEINSKILDLLENEFDDESGEINEEVYEELETLNLEREEKIDSVALYIKNLKHFAEDLKAEKAELAKRQSAAEKKVERLMKYLQDCLNGEKRDTAKYSISYRKSTAVNLDNEDAAIGWCLENAEDCVKKEFSIRKDEIKKLLKAGTEIEGASLVDKVSMSLK